MEFRFDEALPVLRRTPGVLRASLTDLPATWTDATEGPGTWPAAAAAFDSIPHARSVYEIIRKAQADAS